MEDWTVSSERQTEDLERKLLNLQHSQDYLAGYLMMLPRDALLIQNKSLSPSIETKDYPPILDGLIAKPQARIWLMSVMLDISVSNTPLALNDVSGSHLLSTLRCEPSSSSANSPYFADSQTRSCYAQESAAILSTAVACGLATYMELIPEDLPIFWE